MLGPGDFADGGQEPFQPDNIPRCCNLFNNQQLYPHLSTTMQLAMHTY